MFTVPSTKTASGLRAHAAAIRPTAADYAAAALCGQTADMEARADAAAKLERAARIRGHKQRASYLRAHGFNVTA